MRETRGKHEGNMSTSGGAKDTAIRIGRPGEMIRLVRWYERPNPNRPASP